MSHCLAGAHDNLRLLNMAGEWLRLLAKMALFLSLTFGLNKNFSRPNFLIKGGDWLIGGSVIRNHFLIVVNPPCSTFTLCVFIPSCMFSSCNHHVFPMKTMREKKKERKNNVAEKEKCFSPYFENVTGAVVFVTCRRPHLI